MANTLGDLLRRLRFERGRRSRSQLAELARVSDQTIKKIEDGSIAEPKASTLRLLAGGLATELDGSVREDLREALYAELMQAAGTPLPRRPADDEGVDRNAFLAEMEQLHGRRLAVALSTVGWDFQSLPPSAREALKASLIALAAPRDAGANG